MMRRPALPGFRRRGLWAVGLLAWAWPATRLVAQRPTLSPPLAAALGHDTTLTVWLFVRPDVSLADASSRAAILGAGVRTTSRWLHALSTRTSTAVLSRLARERWVRRLQPMGRWRARPTPVPPPVDELGAAAVDTCAAAGDPTYGPSEMPYRQLGLRPLADGGVNGAGVRIVILDGGFNTLHPAFAGVAVTAQRDFVFGDSIVRDEPNDQPGAQAHGTAVWSLFAGSVSPAERPTSSPRRRTSAPRRGSRKTTTSPLWNGPIPSAWTSPLRASATSSSTTVSATRRPSSTATSRSPPSPRTRPRPTASWWSPPPATGARGSAPSSLPAMRAR